MFVSTERLLLRLQSSEKAMRRPLAKPLSIVPDRPFCPRRLEGTLRTVTYHFKSNGVDEFGNKSRAELWMDPVPAAETGQGLDTFALRPHGARQIRIYVVDHPATQGWKRQRLAEAQIALPPWLILVPVDFGGTMWERSSSHRCKLSAELARVFHLARGCAISDTARYRPHSGLHVNPELGGGVRLRRTSRGILRRAKAIGKGAGRTA
jgi:hypothetical protein